MHNLHIYFKNPFELILILQWPFVRYGGVQEPASMVFSVLNAMCHLAILVYRSKVPPTTSLYFVWHGMALVSIYVLLILWIFLIAFLQLISFRV